jgi:hypothetical protein
VDAETLEAIVLRLLRALCRLKPSRIVDFAHLDPLEVAAEVVIVHPKQAIVGVGEADGLLDLRCPVLGIVAPAAVPLEVAPRIAQLNEYDLAVVVFFLATSVVDEFHGDKGVGMGCDEPKRLQLGNVCAATAAGCGHDVVFLVVVEQLLSQASLRSQHTEAWCAGQVSHHVRAQTGLDSFVTSMQLGIGFLEDDHPKLVAMRAREARRPFLARDIVVQHNLLTRSVFVQLNGPDSGDVHFVEVEESLDAAWLFGQGGEHGEKVTVAEGAL